MCCLLFWFYIVLYLPDECFNINIVLYRQFFTFTHMFSVSLLTIVSWHCAPAFWVQYSSWWALFGRVLFFLSVFPFLIFFLSFFLFQVRDCVRWTQSFFFFLLKMSLLCLYFQIIIQHGIALLTVTFSQNFEDILLSSGYLLLLLRGMLS